MYTTMNKKMLAKTMLAGALFAVSVLPVFAQIQLAEIATTVTPPAAATKSTGDDTMHRPGMMKREENMMHLKNASSTATTITPKIDVACVKSAINKRENAIIAAVDTLAGALKSAYTARRDALKAAWDLTDVKARNAAIRAAGKAFMMADRTARKTANQARRSAWATFVTDRKACGSGSGAEEVDNQSLDKGL